MARNRSVGKRQKKMEAKGASFNTNKTGLGYVQILMNCKCIASLCMTMGFNPFKKVRT